MEYKGECGHPLYQRIGPPCPGELKLDLPPIPKEFIEIADLLRQHINRASQLRKD